MRHIGFQSKQCRRQRRLVSDYHTCCQKVMNRTQLFIQLRWYKNKIILVVLESCTSKMDHRVLHPSTRPFIWGIRGVQSSMEPLVCEADSICLVYLYIWALYLFQSHGSHEHFRNLFLSFWKFRSNFELNITLSVFIK